MDRREGIRKEGWGRDRNRRRGIEIGEEGIGIGEEG